ncbi:MAG: DUF7133 domain-containing protein [Planctomycetaceae bacterium]
MDGCRKMRIAGLLAIAFLCANRSPVGAEEAQWIWASGAASGSAAPGDVCFFRRAINLRVEAVGTVEISADDDFELFVNGRKVGAGGSSKEADEFSITDYLTVGRNVVAVRVANTSGNTAAFAARVNIQPKAGGEWFSFNTGTSWKCTTQAAATWQTLLFNDSLWTAARSFGTWGETAPWDHQQPVVSETQVEKGERFQIQKGFGVQRVLNNDQVGSLIAMAFNEFGHIIASQENGPLLLITDRDEDGVHEDVRTYCDQVTSCQGILPLNGEVFVTGVGPEGQALYRLSDDDRNGTLESVKKLVGFVGQPGEHGPHGLVLGPDGMIYISVGNHTQVAGNHGTGETLVDSYEGDLVERYEDPGGHARGIKAPGGTVVRVNLDGTVVEKVAGGIRNAYDLAVHPDGGLFVHDSDMESDIDTTWYRSTALFDITEGGEYGWRSGWATWPEYYLDRLPGLLDTGRGSPTGAICYEHYKFPVRYHNTLFLADWSEGRILAVRVKPRGAGYVADSETFLKGQPLNVTDLADGMDGALYFCTGGRGTAGGVYRVIWNGETPERMSNLGTGIARAVRQPQVTSAWGRQEIAAIKKELGSEWGELVAGVAYSNDNPPHYRTRAMDLMQLFGPVPSEDLLLELAAAPSEAVRVKAAYLMGLHPGERSAQQLEAMLVDPDPRVRRAACEAIMRSRQWPESTAALVQLLGDADRTISFVARRVLERMPVESWKQDVLASEDIRVQLVGALAMINADQSEAMATEVLALCSELITGFLTDAQFVDTLRVCQVALHRSKIDPASLTTLRTQIAEEFPAGDTRVNQELVKLAAYLDADEVAERALEFIRSDAPKTDRTVVAMYMQFLSHDWTAVQRFEILKYYETAAEDAGTGSLPLYLMAVTRDFAESFTPEDAVAILEQGSHWPNAAMAAIYRLPRPIDDETAATLRSLDRQILKDDLTGDVYKRLRTGIVAMLSTATDEESVEYLREVWRKDPERREIVALGLSQHPEGENWDYLVRSLNILEGESAMEVVKQLKTVRVATDDPTALRQLILIGLKAESESRPIQPVDELLLHWTGVERSPGAKVSMATWQAWYAKTYPDRPAAVQPTDEDSKWDLDELAKYIESDAGRHGDAAAGRKVYVTAQCADCHRFGNVGDSVGPELTSVARRFTRREVLESILFPAHIISDQYMSKKVLTLDGKIHVGMVSQDGAGFLQIRDSKNNITRIDETKVDQVLPNNSSVMPSGLLDSLSLQEISDLLAYMGVLPSVEVANAKR